MKSGVACEQRRLYSANSLTPMMIGD